MSDEGDISTFLEERPELRDALKTVVTVDQQNGTWTFDDVPIDSGQFGELVSNGIVESIGDEYAISNPDAAQAALFDDQSISTPSDTSQAPAVQWQTVDRTALGALIAALAFVALVRAHPLQKIYRNDNVVLSGNDPYYYRYWVEQVLGESTSVFNLETLTALPGGITNGEPLLVAILWWVSELFGDGVAVVGHVIAVSAVTGLAIAVMGVRSEN
jgi:dolichyl-diphosphooligosaccharide--protein glycosyltransferase